MALAPSGNGSPVVSSHHLPVSTINVSPPGDVSAALNDYTILANAIGSVQDGQTLLLSGTFDWTQPPLLRLHVHRRSADSFQLTLSFHHAILDGWSLSLLLSWLLAEYDRGHAPEVPRLASRFRDYVRLEREAVAQHRPAYALHVVGADEIAVAQEGADLGRLQQMHRRPRAAAH